MLMVLSAAPAAVLSAAPAAAAPGDAATAQPDRFAQIVIDSMTPSMVTSSSGPTVAISGHVINTSSRTLRDLGIRLERGDALAGASQLRSALAGEHPPIAAATDFSDLSSDTLAPGAQASFSLTVPLSGAGGLQISQRGVYPLQLNVNGLPDYGGVAQVAGSRTLLPVLSLPPDRSRAAAYTDPGSGDASSTTPGLGADGSVSADTSSPSRFTLLWPIAAPPQLAPGALGGNTEPVRLISEDMARSLSPGGRLDSVLAPLRAIADAAPASAPDPGSASTAPPAPGAQSGQTSDLARSMCLAVDPNLLVTVRAMSLGYVVSSDPSDPTSSTVPGTGQDAATSWLNELRDVASRLCVVALPFAGVDLSALAEIDNSGLTATALDSPADVVDSVLGVKSVRGLTIPALGAINQAGARLLEDTNHSTVLTSAVNLSTEQPQSSGAYRVGPLAAQSYDEPVTAALAALGTNPTTPAITPADQMVDLSAESPLSRRQAGIGALAFAAVDTPDDERADSGQGSAGQTSAAQLPTTGRSQVVLPSLYWSPSTDDANALISTAEVLLGSRVATPTPLTSVVGSADVARTAARLAPPPGVGPVSSVSVPLPEQTATAMREQADLSYQLQGSLVSSADVETTPERYLAPLREDMLRSLTVPAEAGAQTRTRLADTRAQTIRAVTSTLDRMRAAVTILDPGGRYTLASERSPLLLVVRNDLALPIRVDIRTSAPHDLDIGDVGTIEIPARGTRQLQLPTRAETSEAITVTISIATVTGLPMGSDIRLSVHSNAYGKALFIITIIAGAALVLLTARRLWHRFRGEPDPADADRPEPDEQERLLAAATYQQRRRTLHIEEVHSGAWQDDAGYSWPPDPEPAGATGSARPSPGDHGSENPGHQDTDPGSATGPNPDPDPDPEPDEPVATEDTTTPAEHSSTPPR
ncbi:DUF6049 family protein [Gordonia sp. L191]|uniref:DUF6049 family protein n=1 Tax=Gordonia sp. L191 TaxID=2982699 RepID=UPI0024BFC952|nr:DUF6049 family protein [Gordonia sp. L191]WHU50121.1 DUF6049 family protein [Gordonia sp. L191]